MPPSHARRFPVLPAVLLCLIVGCASQQSKNRPNVVFILIDTLRADHLGSYGFPVGSTPHLDAVASESILFERCLAPAPWTKPSVASMFTSLYPEAHGVVTAQWPPKPNEAGETDILPSEAVTLAEMFKQAGYRTAAFVSNDWMKDPYGFSQGFDTYVFDQRSFANPNRTVDMADKWVAGQPADAPYFLYIHIMHAHGPYEFDEKTFQEMKKGLGPSRDGRMSDAQLGGLYEYALSTWKGREAMARSYLNWRAAYAAGVKRCDEVIGHFFGLLRARGAWDDTLFVITSDHGEGLMDHGFLEHGDNFNIEALRVPLIIRLPGGASGGRRVRGWVSLLDLVPTLSDLCGLAGPDQPWAGRSLSAAINGREGASRPMFSSASEHEPQQESVVLDDQHLIVNLAERKVQLFDMKADPGESTDISLPQPATRKELLALLEKHRRTLASHPSFGKQRGVMTPEQKEALRSLGYLQ